MIAMSRLFVLAFVTALALMSGSASAQMSHDYGSARNCAEPTLACATTATPAFGPDGSLWLVWAAGGRVSVVRSRDLGRSFSEPVSVNLQPVRLDSGPDERPKIAVDEGGRIYIAYATFKDDAYNGEVFFSRSTDGGESFAPPQPITTDPASQRFEAIEIDPSGKLFAAWIDKRHAAAARSDGKSYVGAALAFAWSDDTGATFSSAGIAKDNTCECCRLGVAFAGPGRPVVLFRNVFGDNIRDHAITTFIDPATPGPIYRVSVDNWQIEACPHHGPSLAVAADGTYHVVWFTGGSARQGVFYARSVDGGRTFSAPKPLGDKEHTLSRPDVLTIGDNVWLAWKEFDGKRTTVGTMVSHDNGTTWSAPQVVAATSERSDHPLLVSDGHGPFLSWLTRQDGYRLVALENTP
jgi:BNR/Asp-box repeat